jgi:transposase
MRQVLCGIFYVLQNGGTWAAMPHDLPSGKTCWFYFNRFAGDGTWERLARAIYPAARARAERDPEPSEAVMDAQSVKTTKKGGRRAASVTMRARR